MNTEKHSHTILLPDSTGFAFLDSKKDGDTCCILDAYGEIRFNLNVPFEM